MNSYLTEDFLSHFGKLPQNVKEKGPQELPALAAKSQPSKFAIQARASYRANLFLRVGIDWRALGLREENDIYWFWIGSHAEYDKLLNQL